MADFSEGGWSKLNDDSWMGVEGGRINVAKPGNLGIQCLKCGEGHIIEACNNCGNNTYKIGYSPERHMGLFCSECNQGFTNLTCDKCGCENPVSRKTIATKGCYIVTATCGLDSHEVAFFYGVRDDYLSNFWTGKKVIKTYYAISPYWANIISKNSTLRYISYRFIVNPLYEFFKKAF